MTDAASPTASEYESSSLQEEIFAGIHFFILADLFVFAALFTGFMVERTADIALFTESAARLNPWVGVLNTLILVTSGLCVVFAVNAARAGFSGRAERWVAAAFVIGAGFGISKVLEYSDKISQGITMLSNDFFMFYYALTGAHFLHFIGGMVALAFVWFRLRTGVLDTKFLGVLESIALYWHMVDLLWIFIFPVLYLLGGVS